MRVGYVEIENFRGIKQLRWVPAGGVNCLIGPGDSCKTTILDAVALALSPRHTLSFDDLDFFGGDFKNAAKIIVTLTDLPDEFISDSAYASYLRGISNDGKVVDEPPLPENGQLALSIMLSIDEGLEGTWTLWNERVAADDLKQRSLSYAHRSAVAPARLGVYADRHLSWGRNSTLSRMSEGAAGTQDILARAGRLARNHFKTEAAELFKLSLENVTLAAKKVGLALPSTIAAGLDVQNLAITNGSIAIHDGEVPLRALGMGSSRLLVAALQDHSKASSCLTIIDEVEHGLEPHRIVRLLKHLKSKDRVSPQVFITSHSPVVIRELSVHDLHIVRRSEDGGVTVRRADKKYSKRDPQAPPRSMPEAYLAPTVLIGEGKTEVGLLKGLDDYWVTQHLDNLALKGIALADGGGVDHAPALAGQFCGLGYQVGLLLDSDQDPADKEILGKLENAGVKVFRWDRDCSTEDVLFRQLPLAAVEMLFDYTLTFLEPEAILDAANKPRQPDDCFNSIEQVRACLNDATVLDALAARAKGKKKRDSEDLHGAWYKDIAKAEHIAQNILGPHLREAHKGVQETVSALRSWIDGHS
ncbi:Predicted ATP-dependent endonuclease of the OLD family, contains P-loop ATPase and TOPRIM domains [Pelagibacterium luteolum]|uniref:Predicted ATP-dependent endonuclease of the OLD family, contains P-loop ATPase and TOPRIM domains n=1 Tax=Pelagibacterium luteolum TaxID=440168 RepID=A0A1G7XDN4_9HYPH|nr:Predicted ATP-dependent endonuclease of the OLD family, contains P-loop ATPase and TOPRIM domains [Pelagibacterium luteolum]